MASRRKPDIDFADSEPPNTIHMGGRLRFERERLKLSRSDLAVLMSMTEAAVASWEDSTGSSSASALTMFGHVGADVLFIVTGCRDAGDKSDVRLPTDRFRDALSQLDFDARRRMLLHLVTEELRSIVNGR